MKVTILNSVVRGDRTLKALFEDKDEEGKETRCGKYVVEKHVSRGKKNSKVSKAGVCTVYCRNTGEATKYI